MRTISKIFWAILQHISAPSEKEIRERLLALLLVFLVWAPAYCLPLTPDQAEVRAEQELQTKYYQEAQDLERRFNNLALSNVKTGTTTHRLYLNTEYNEEAITLFKNNLEKANWDVYDDHGPGVSRMLKVVRHNTLPI